MKDNVETLPGGRVNTKGAAKHIGCSESLLTKQRIVGKGPRYLRLGGKVMYRLADLDAWISGRAVETEDSRKDAA